MRLDLVLLGVAAAFTWSMSTWLTGSTGREIGAQRVTLATQLTNVVFILPLMLLIHSQFSAAPLACN